METVVATAAINKTVDDTLRRLLNATIRSVKYPFDVGANVKALQSAMKELLAKREDVNTKIENGERLGEKVTKEVSGWINQVEAIKKDVEEIEQRYQARYKCLGSYSFNCRLNYTISKRTVNTLSDVQKLCNKWKTYESFTMQVPPPAVQEVSMEPITSSTSDKNLAQALECINNDPVGVIGLVGMGGVGKTCLLERINNNYTQNPNNFKVVFVTASQECSIAKLQSSVAKKLGLVIDTDEVQQANIIFNFLKEKNFLLLLDDLWDGFDLKKVGIPFPLGLGEKYNRKVVLTTRSSQVCGKMGVRKEIRVACLNNKESWSLFREKVGNDTLDSHPLIPFLAQKVIDQLGGLPLALIIIGSAMYGRRDPRDWEYAIDQIQSPNSIEIDILDSEESLYHRLKFSYDNLQDETLKKCFLSCSLWPEDYVIRRDYLIRCWIGLDYITESDMQKAHDVGHTVINTLLGQCLLEEKHNFHIFDCVKMHDVIRSMACWIACGYGVGKNKWVIKAGVGLEESPINYKELWYDAECVSLMHNELTEFKCPLLSFPSNLTTLMFAKNRLDSFSLPIPLTRLRYLDLSRNNISNFPLEICDLVDLQHLDLSRNLIESIPDELKSLINLRFLYFAQNYIRYFPEGVISGLKALEVLDFCDSYVEMIFEAYFFEEIKCLENLKTLGITVSNLSDLEKFKVLSTTVPIRFLSLKCVTSASLSSTSLCSTGTKSPLVKLAISKTQFKEFVIETKQFPYLEELHLVNNETLKEVMWRGILPMDVFPRLRSLLIVNCIMEHLTWIVHLPFLQTLQVTLCSFMKELVRDDQEGKNTTTCLSLRPFSSLKIMKLYNMENLESICDPHFALPSLRILQINECPKLKKLPFPNGIIPSTLETYGGFSQFSQ